MTVALHEGTCGRTVPDVDPARTSLRLTGIVWLIALVPGGLLAFVVGVFALTPAECPDGGGSVLCRYPSTSAVAIIAVTACLLGALVATVLAIVAGTQARQVRMLLLSGASAAAAVTVIVVGGASWT